MDDSISRQAAIGLIHGLYPSAPIMRMNRKRWEEKYKPYIEAEKALEMLPSVQPESTADAEFWRKRADYYYDICSKLIADMGAGVKIESVKIDETGITFTKKKPPEQQIDLQELEDRFGEYVRFVVNDMLTGEGKRWTR